MRGRIIHDRMNRIQAQSVEVIFIQPVECVVDKEVANGAATFSIKVDGIAPWRLVPRSEELWSVEAEVVPFGPEVVVDDIQKHHQAVCMSALNEALKIFRTTVEAVWSERQNAIVPPVALSGKI